MTLIKVISVISLLAVASLAPTSALAKDCGFPPDYFPELPNAETSTRDELTVAVQAVRAFGELTNAHLSCLDENRAEYFLNMSKEQQSRWLEDYNKIVEDLTALQEGLNVQIRAFNARREANNNSN